MEEGKPVSEVVSEVVISDLEADVVAAVRSRTFWKAHTRQRGLEMQPEETRHGYHLQNDGGTKGRAGTRW